MQNRLKDKVGIVTGSARGIGRATAIEFGKEGASVVVNFATSEAAANEVVQQIRGFGSKAIAVKGDVGVSDDRRKIVDVALKEFGKIDILVNNAGIHYVCNTLDKVTEEVFDRTISVNLAGTLFMSKLVAPHMIKQGKGCIINTSTASIFFAPPGDPHYFASKGGIETLTRVLASMLAPEIRVNCVAPGCIETEMFAHHSPEGKKLLASTTPLLRLGLPEEVAKTSLFLASDEASFYTGATLLVDGGRVTAYAKPVLGANTRKEGLDHY